MKNDSQTVARVYSSLERHIDKFWPKNKKEYFTWSIGPIRQSLPRFSVCRISPLSDQEPWLYISLGAWEVFTENEYRMEFILMSPEENARHVETLAMLANFHADEKYKMNVGKSIDIGHGWMAGSLCDHLLISLPYPIGPEFETCEVDSLLTAKFFWLLPITKTEHMYLKTHGLESLEQIFDEVEIDFLDPQRDSVV